MRDKIETAHGGASWQSCMVDAVSHGHTLFLRLQTLPSEKHVLSLPGNNLKTVE
jgi:hypothetical protein